MNRPMAVGMMVLGAALALASVLIDVAGIGTEGFGVAQIIGIILGIVLIVAGWMALSRLQRGGPPV
ncbi:MAG: hypothetical protein GXY36_02955 [Chloroflexi bacterium]|jgi:hypothetical protein|nr:hypothetical protein [Chloroflexota bacterium]